MNSLAAIIEIENLNFDNDRLNQIFEQKIFSELVFFHNLREDDIENYFKNNFYFQNKEKKFIKVKNISNEFTQLLQSLESYYFILINPNDEINFEKLESIYLKNKFRTGFITAILNTRKKYYLLKLLSFPLSMLLKVKISWIFNSALIFPSNFFKDYYKNKIHFSNLNIFRLNLVLEFLRVDFKNRIVFFK